MRQRARTPTPVGSAENESSLSAPIRGFRMRGFGEQLYAEYGPQTGGTQPAGRSPVEHSARRRHAVRAICTTPETCSSRLDYSDGTRDPLDRCPERGARFGRHPIRCAVCVLSKNCQCVAPKKVAHPTGVTSHAWAVIMRAGCIRQRPVVPPGQTEGGGRLDCVAAMSTGYPCEGPHELVVRLPEPSPPAQGSPDVICVRVPGRRSRASCLAPDTPDRLRWRK